MKKYCYNLVALGVILLAFIAFPHHALAAVIPATPDLSVSHHISANWSGYVATKGSYTAVSATWIVPAVQPSQTLTSHAVWVGIGGQTTADLIQAGTYAISSDNKIEYSVWYELLPAASIPINMAVHPGDSISVAIWETAPNVWHISIANNTTKETFQKIVAYQSSHMSAEWIVERPIIDDTLAPLDVFGTVAFTDAMVVQRGEAVTAAQTGAQLFYLIERHNQLAIAVPSAFTSNGREFIVSRTSAPSFRSAAVSVGYITLPTGGGWIRGRTIGKTIRWGSPGQLITVLLQ